MNDLSILRLIKQAQTHLANGYVDGAIGQLQEALSIDTEIAEAHALLALCLLMKKRLFAAKHEAGLALALDGESEYAHYAMASVATANRRFRTALNHIDIAIQLNPVEPDYYVAKANIYSVMDQTRQILPLLEKALSLSPANPSVLASLSEYYRGKNDMIQAERYAYESLRSEPANSEGLVAMGYVLLDKGNLQSAKEHAIEALRNNADDTAALYLMSSIKAKSSFLLGFWWRYNSWLIKLGSTKAIMVLLCMFITYSLARLVTKDLGYTLASSVISYLWLAFVIYTFVGPGVFRQQLKKELEQVRLHDNF